MCFGKSSKTQAAPTPAPATPTQFGYVNADTSNSQQRQAAVNSSTNAQTQTFGSELGSSTPPTTPASQGAA